MARVGLLAREPLRVTVISAPTSEPVTVSGVLDQARIESSLPVTAYVSGLIQLSREYAENYQRRALITQTLEYKLDGFDGDVIVLPRPPLQSVSQITYLDSSGTSTLLSASVYRVTTAGVFGEVSLASGESWPVTSDVADAVQIRYAAGYGGATDVPQMTRHAILMFCTVSYDFRDAESVDLSAVNRLLNFERVSLV